MSLQVEEEFEELEEKMEVVVVLWEVLVLLELVEVEPGKMRFYYCPNQAHLPVEVLLGVVAVDVLLTFDVGVDEAIEAVLLPHEGGAEVVGSV
jgi:hypothetical protein